MNARDRDIDYAALAVERAIVEKFGRHNDLQELRVVAHDRTISVEDGDRRAEGTRDSLLAGLRKSSTYDALWEVLAEADQSPAGGPAGRPHAPAESRQKNSPAGNRPQKPA